MAAGEQLDQPLVNPGQLPDPARAGLPPGELVAQPQQLGGELARVDRLGGGGELVQRPGVDRQVPALAGGGLAPGQVDHERMAMQLRVGWTARLSGDFGGWAAGVMSEHRHTDGAYEAVGVARTPSVGAP